MPAGLTSRQHTARFELLLEHVGDLDGIDLLGRVDEVLRRAARARAELQDRLARQVAQDVGDEVLRIDVAGAIHNSDGLSVLGGRTHLVREVGRHGRV